MSVDHKGMVLDRQQCRPAAQQIDEPRVEQDSPATRILFSTSREDMWGSNCAFYFITPILDPIKP